MSQMTRDYLLIIRAQNGNAEEHKLLTGRSIFIGTSSDCGIQIAGNEIAELHCLLDVSETGVSIQDWASSSGTILNGEPIDGKVDFGVSDSVMVGDAVLTIRQNGVDRDDTNQPAANRDLADADPQSEQTLTASSRSSIDTALSRIQGLIGEASCTSQFDTPESATTNSDLAAENDSSDKPKVNGMPWERDEQTCEQATETDFAVETETEVEIELEAEVEVNELQDSDPCVAEPVSKDDSPDLLPSPESEFLVDKDAQAEDSNDDIDLWNDSIELDSGWDEEPTTDSLNDLAFDRETVELLSEELKELRTILAEREAHIEYLSQPQSTTDAESVQDAKNDELVNRIEQLSHEANEHDSKMSIVVDLLEAAEFKNQTELEERKALETWLGEVESRVQQRQAEWRCELDHSLKRLRQVIKQRDHAQRQLKQHASQSDDGQAYKQTMEQLQAQNETLQQQIEDSRKQIVELQQQAEAESNRETDDIQQQRALIAKERADVSRMRYELSQKLAEFENVSVLESTVDTETQLRLKTLREHLREIHEQERFERESKGDSLISRISNLWKRVDEF